MRYQDVVDYMARNDQAINSLVEAVVGRAMTDLPCLRLASTAQEREAMSQKVKGMITEVVETVFIEELNKAHKLNEPFIVTVHRTGLLKLQIDVSLTLGSTKIE